jgi:ABC-type sugar transport system permease subunit
MKGSIMKGSTIKPYLFILPAMLVIAFIFFYPVIQVFIYSFQRISSAGSVFIGLGNYDALLHDDLFLRSLSHNLYLLISVPILVLVSLVFAILLFEQIPLWRFYRSVFYMPYMIAIPVVGIVFSYIFQLNGILNQMLKSLNLGFLALDWLGSSKHSLNTLMFVIVWKEFGFGVVLFFARLMSVDEQLFEAARLEGARWFQVFRRITVPQLSAVIEFYAVIMIITMLSWVFNYVYVMTSGGPGGSTMVSEYYIYLTAFRYNQMGKASAASIVLLLVTLLLIVARSRLSRSIEVDVV